MVGYAGRLCALAAALAGAVAHPASPQSWIANPQSLIPNPTLEEQEHFLRTANIESVVPIEKGITHSLKATLTDGRLTHAAHIQTIDLHMPVFHGKDGSQEVDFTDSWKYNVAAYRLAKLLHFTYMTPVSVVRAYQGKPAAFTWWVDNVLMDDRDRLRDNVQPPDLIRWNRQMDLIRLFDQLIYNMDRSQENILITADWNVWMIDHTRSFRKWSTLRNPAAISWATPELLQSLQALRREDLDRGLSDLLGPEQIAAILLRRDLIVARLTGQPALTPAPLP
jgi:hypothetical protein